MGKRYTDEFLISELQRFFKVNDKVPFQHDMTNANGYPSYLTYVNKFGSWGKSLQLAGLPLKGTRTYINDKCCSICGGKPSKTGNWYYNDNYDKICNNCYVRDRKHILGTVNPNSSSGLGIIAEYIVFNVLNNTIMCNTKHSFNFPVDLISDKYGTINVKSATLRKYNNRHATYWGFSIGRNSTIPNHYVAIGFNNDKTKIEKVWIIPGNASIVHTNICITNSPKGLSRALQYEVDPNPYNKVYQELDIYTLPEFCNLPRDDKNDN